MRSQQWIRSALAVGCGLLLAACTQASSPAKPAASQAEPYRIGITSALTGPLADSFAPVYEGINVYFQQVNDRGGINGHPVQLLSEDDGGDATKATSNATKLVQQEKVALMVVNSTSATYGPILNIGRTAGTPLVFVGVCPSESFPPADPLVFCTSSFGALYEPTYAVQFIKETSREPVKLALLAVDIPLARTAMEHAARLASEAGMEVVSKQAMPAAVADYTPFATQIQQSGANWVFAYSPWSGEIGPFDALQKLGWRGNYLLWAHQPAEEELSRRKVDTLYGLGGNAMFAENLPVHQEIRQAADKFKPTYPAEQLAEGWVSALAIDQAVRGCGWPCSTQGMQAALGKLNVDTKSLRGGPLVYSGDNHYRTKAWYKVYHWDSAQNKIMAARDWVGLDVTPNQ